MWKFFTPKWAQDLLKYLSPTALQQTQALMVAGAFAMGAASMGVVNQAQVEAQGQAESGETDQAIETVASANQDARESIHGSLRAEAAKDEATLNAGVAELKRKLEAGLVTTDEVEDELDAIITRHGLARDRARSAYRRTYTHERLQLEAMSWTPEQQILVEHRIEELRQIELETVEALVEGDLEGALSLDASPGKVEVTYQPVHPQFRGSGGGILPTLGRLLPDVAKDTVSTQQPSLTVLNPAEVATEDYDALSVVPDVPLGTETD